MSKDVILLTSEDFDVDELASVLQSCNTDQLQWGDWNEDRACFTLNTDIEDIGFMKHVMHSKMSKKVTSEVERFCNKTHDAVKKWIGQCDVDPSLGNLVPFIDGNYNNPKSIIVGVRAFPKDEMNSVGKRRRRNMDDADWEETGLSESTM